MSILRIKEMSIVINFIVVLLSHHLSVSCLLNCPKGYKRVYNVSGLLWNSLYLLQNPKLGQLIHFNFMKCNFSTSFVKVHYNAFHVLN